MIVKHANELIGEISHNAERATNMAPVAGARCKDARIHAPTSANVTMTFALSSADTPANHKNQFRDGDHIDVDAAAYAI